jgi:hypothetical protein
LNPFLNSYLNLYLNPNSKLRTPSFAEDDDRLVDRNRERIAERVGERERTGERAGERERPGERERIGERERGIEREKERERERERDGDRGYQSLHTTQSIRKNIYDDDPLSAFHQQGQEAAVRVRYNTLLAQVGTPSGVRSAWGEDNYREGTG